MSSEEHEWKLDEETGEYLLLDKEGNIHGWMYCPYIPELPNISVNLIRRIENEHSGNDQTS